MAKVYGLFLGGHNHSTTLIVDGEVKYAIEDERITRKKAGYSWFEPPIFSLKTIEELTGITLEDADKVVVADPTLLHLVMNENSDFPMKQEIQDFRRRLIKIKDKIEFINHHDGHAYSTYYSSGFTEKTLVLSSDGGSFEKEYGGIWLAEDGKMNRVHSVGFLDQGSLANLWFHSCRFFGWRGTKDEGKIMGMAGHGRYNEYLYNAFNECVKYKGNLEFDYAENAERISYVYTQLEKEGWFEGQQNRQDFAYNLQKFTEDIFMKYLKDVANKYPEYKKLAVAGGLFANVKLNQVINESGLYEGMFVFPAMGDSGVSFGAAVKGSIDSGDWKGVRKLENSFLGIGYDSKLIHTYSLDLPVSSKPLDYAEVGKLIHEGNIIGLFNGRFEFGPRALGARSVMVRPTDAETHEVLNTRLERHEIMPFAPFVMAEYANVVFDVPQSHHTAEFMTMCYTVREEWADKIPAVVHRVDNTGRPQIVYKDKNPVFWNILNEYNKLSGIPVMLNTSFNGHGEPIINAPDQAFSHLLKGTIDYLVAEDRIYKLETNA
jgi:carbamoyltransferase